MSETGNPNAEKEHTTQDLNEAPSSTSPASSDEGVGHEAEAVDQPGTEPAPERVPLILSSTSNKGLPSELIALDRALDRLGREKYPDTWGRSKHWSLMPFLKRANGYCQRTIEGNGADRKITYHPVDSAIPLEELAPYARMYRRVCRSMVHYLQSGPGKAVVMNVDGDIIPVEHERRGIWNNKRRAIFYTGYVRFGDDKQLHRVMVDESSFEDFMSLPPELRVMARDNVLLARIRTVIQRWGKRKEAKITRDRLDEIVLPVLKTLQIERLDSLITTHVWQRLACRQTRSQPKKRDKQLFEDSKEDLKKKLTAELVRP